MQPISRLLKINKRLRTAVEACEAGKIKGHPDLELIKINKFVTDIEEVAEELIVDVTGLWKAWGHSPTLRRETIAVSSKRSPSNHSRPPPQGGLRPSRARIQEDQQVCRRPPLRRDCQQRLKESRRQSPRGKEHVSANPVAGIRQTRLEVFEVFED